MDDGYREGFRMPARRERSTRYRGRRRKASDERTRGHPNGRNRRYSAVGSSDVKGRNPPIADARRSPVAANRQATMTVNGHGFALK